MITPHSKATRGNQSVLCGFFSLALVLVFVLQWVWPMPGTIALRNSALGVLLVLTFSSSSVLVARASFKIPRLSSMPMPLVLFGLLTLWILGVGVLWADEPDLSRKEFVGQWLVPIGCALMACLLVHWAKVCGKQQALIRTVFYAFFFAVLVQNAMGLTYLLATNTQPFRQASVLYLPRLMSGFVNGTPWLEAFDGNFGEKVSFVNNMFVAFVLAEIGQRLLQGKRWLAVSNRLLFTSLLMAVLCSYWLSFRNGNIGLMSLVFFWGVMMVLAHKGRYGIAQKLGALVLLIAIIAGLGYAFVKSDPRWGTFSETAAIAIKGDPQKAWLYRKDYPLLKNGQPVDGSAYERISWIKEGIKLSIDHPLGTGFDRNAFFDTLDRDYQLNGLVRGGHAHSGLVDFMVANGIPGVVLWLAFLISCAWVGWRKLDSGQVAQGLTVIFLISGAINRGILDSNIRDHVLQQFLFLLTIYVTIQLAPTPCANHDKVNHEPTA